MKNIYAINIITILLLISSLSCTSSESEIRTEKSSRIIVYYTHGTLRCRSCRDIEALTKLTIDTYFKDEQSNGSIVFRPLHREKEENSKYLKLFKITYNTVIIVKIEKGEIIEWKRFDDCWDHLEDPPAFMASLKKNIEMFLKEAPQS